jgi:hypothetical protein
MLTIPLSVNDVSWLQRHYDETSFQNVAFVDYTYIHQFWVADDSLREYQKIKAVVDEATSARSRLSFESQQQVKSALSLLTSPLYWTRAFPTSAFMVHQTANEIFHTSSAWSELNPSKILASLCHFCASDNAKMLYHQPWTPPLVAEPKLPGLKYDIPFFKDVDRVPWGPYPSDRGHSENTGIPQPPKWGWTNTEEWEKCGHWILEAWRLFEVPNQAATFGRPDFWNKPPHRIDDATYQSGKYLIILPIALLVCLQWLEDPFLWRRLNPYVKALVRGALRYQLHEVRL